MTQVRRPPFARAVTPPGPYFWDEYQCEHGVNQVDNEVFEVVSDPSLTVWEAEARLGELKALIDRAEVGELTPDRDHKPANVDPELWEIRTTFGGRPFRLYYAEPKDYTTLLLGLKAHLKRVDGSEAEISRRQNEQMSKAINRYRAGRSRGWRGRPELEGQPCSSTCVDPPRTGI